MRSYEKISSVTKNTRRNEKLTLKLVVERSEIESEWTHRPGVKVDTISYSVNQLGLITSSLFPVMFSMCVKYDTAFL